MECRVCDSQDLDPVIDLGKQPWCNHFLKQAELGTEPFYPLRVVFCRHCATAQLDHTIRKEVMFGDHTYLSGVTESLSRHFREVAQEVDRRFAFAGTKAVLDIGSNDGTQLKHYQALGYDVLGVESSKTTARLAMQAGVPTVHAFFNQELVRSIGRRFQVVNAAGVFFHLEELHSAAEGIREALTGDGVFVVQFLYMKRIVENMAFDQIYHEHLLYYNLNTIEVLLRRHGLSMFDAYLAPIHGGSIVGFATHQGTRSPSERLIAMRHAEDAEKSNTAETYRSFAARIDQVKERDLAYLGNALRRGLRAFGFGAPVKGNTLLNYFGIGPETLECLVEKNPLRRGLYSPGMHIPIVMEEEIAAPPDIYYVLAWNFRDEILARNRDLIDRGTGFYFPVRPADILDHQPTA